MRLTTEMCSYNNLTCGQREREIGYKYIVVVVVVVVEELWKNLAHIMAGK